MPTSTPLTFLPIGGPTALLEAGGLTFLVDPTFDPPGTYNSPSGATLTKTTGPAIPADDLPAVDVVLLSHEQHADNLDTEGRAVAAAAPLVLAPPASAEKLGSNATGLAPWTTHTIQSVTITAVPAQHGPDDRAHLMGDVAGFVIEAPGVPTIYVSGDNASLAVVEEVATRFPDIAVAVLFAGGAQSPALGDAYLTLSSDLAAEAARLLGEPLVLGMHTDGWAHFSDDRASLERAFAAAGLDSRLVPITLGERVDLAELGG